MTHQNKHYILFLTISAVIFLIGIFVILGGCYGILGVSREIFEGIETSIQTVPLYVFLLIGGLISTFGTVSFGVTLHAWLKHLEK